MENKIPTNKTGMKEEYGHMATLLGPSSVDQTVRQAIQLCWWSLPPQRRKPAVVASQIRRIVDRALDNFSEDSRAFSRPRRKRR
jgi:hypothetical protein